MTFCHTLIFRQENGRLEFEELADHINSFTGSSSKTLVINDGKPKQSLTDVCLNAVHYDVVSNDDFCQLFC